MSSDHVHNWYVISRADEKGSFNTKRPSSAGTGDDLILKVERCSWCGERREYRDTGHYDA